MSIEAGIPGTAMFKDYLAKVAVYITLRKGIESTERFLSLRGWESPNELNLFLNGWVDESQFSADVDGPQSYAQLKSLIEQAKRSAYFSCLRSELLDGVLVSPIIADLLRVHEGTSASLSTPPYDWRAILLGICGANKSLVDSFFAEMCSQRVPITGTRYIAFLAKLLNWRLLLTTNFDDLIETAMAEEGMPCNTFEIPEDTTLPRPALVRRQRAIVKLHGGTFGLKAGWDLDRPLDPYSRDTLLRYIPPNALILVLGYSGSDQRVRTVLEGHLERTSQLQPLQQAEKHEPYSTPGVLWVRRSGDPADGTQEWPTDHLRYCHYHDAGLFLQELYSRLANVHPITHKNYDSLPHSFRRRPQPFTFGSKDSDADFRTTVFCHDTDDQQASDVLAYFLRERENNFHTIYVDMSQVPHFTSRELKEFSFIELTQRILHKIRHSDPELPRYTLSPLNAAAAKAFDEKRDSGVEINNELIAEVEEACVERVVQALRRGKYLIALDGIHRFAELTQRHPVRTSEAIQTPDETLDPEQKEIQRREYIKGELQERMARFLKRLISNGSAFGESRIVISGQSRRIKLLLEGVPAHCMVRVANVRELNLRPGQDERHDFRSDDTTLSSAYEWDHKVILTLIGLTRRPLSIIGIRHMMGLLYTHRRWCKENSPWKFTTRMPPFCKPKELNKHISVLLGEKPDSSKDPPHRRQIYRFVDKLMCQLDRSLLYCRDGGHYSLTEDASISISGHISLWTQKHPVFVADLHRFLAWYYYEDMYLTSRHVDAFMEYLYHASMSIKTLGSSPSDLLKTASPSGIQRIVAVVNVIETECWAIVSMRAAERLLNAISNLRHVIDEHSKTLTGAFPKKESQSVSKVLTSALQKLDNTGLHILMRIRAFGHASSSIRSCVRNYVLASDKHDVEDGLRAALCNGSEADADSLLSEALPHSKEMTALCRESRSAAVRITRLMEYRGLEAQRVLELTHYRFPENNNHQMPATLFESVINDIEWLIGDESSCGGVLSVEGCSDLIRRLGGELIRARYRLLRARLSYGDSLGLFEKQWYEREPRVPNLPERECELQRTRLENEIEELLTMWHRSLRALSRHADSRRMRTHLYKAYFETLRGRLYYYLGDFPPAYERLTTAIGTVAGQAGIRETVGEGYATIMLSECLVLHAKSILDDPKGHERKDDQPNALFADSAFVQKAHVKLERAQMFLQNSEKLLREAPYDTWAWSWMYLLKATRCWQVLRLPWEVPSNGLLIRSVRYGGYDLEIQNVFDDLESILFHGFRAIHRGSSIAKGDQKRSQQFLRMTYLLTEQGKLALHRRRLIQSGILARCDEEDVIYDEVSTTEVERITRLATTNYVIEDNPVGPNAAFSSGK